MPTPQHQNFPWLTRVLYILTSPLQSKIAAQLCIAMCSMMTSLHTRLLKNIINRLRNGKAPGGDCAPNILLKNISRKTTVFLIYIYNSCLKLCYFPKEWKHPVVIPILKPGKDPSNLSNYRPIRLISSISKVFERIILKRLNTFVSTQAGRI
jgi:hypothetical protein